MYRFRKYVSYGFPIIIFCNPGVHYETPSIYLNLLCYKKCITRLLNPCCNDLTERQANSRSAGKEVPHAATTLLRDKLTVAQMVKRFSALCGTLKSCTLFTTFHHWSIPSHSTIYHLTAYMSILIPPSYLPLFSQAIKNAKHIHLKHTTQRTQLLMEKKSLNKYI